MKFVGVTGELFNIEDLIYVYFEHLSEINDLGGIRSLWTVVDRRFFDHISAALTF